MRTHRTAFLEFSLPPNGPQIWGASNGSYIDVVDKGMALERKPRATAECVTLEVKKIPDKSYRRGRERGQARVRQSGERKNSNLQLAKEK